MGGALTNLFNTPFTFLLAWTNIGHRELHYKVRRHVDHYQSTRCPDLDLGPDGTTIRLFVTNVMREKPAWVQIFLKGHLVSMEKEGLCL